MAKKFSVILLVVVVVVQMFTITVLAEGIEADISVDLDKSIVTVVAKGLPADKDFSLMAYFNEDLDYINQYRADEKGEAAISYPSGKALADGGTVRILINGTEFKKEIKAIPVEGVEITGGSALTMIKYKSSLELGAKVSPDDAANKNVTWKSVNPMVATVADGVVKGVSRGLAIITVTTDDGSFSKSVLVRVY